LKAEKENNMEVSSGIKSVEEEKTAFKITFESGGVYWIPKKYDAKDEWLKLSIALIHFIIEKGK
jgi:hypothetical protein